MRQNPQYKSIAVYPGNEECSGKRARYIETARSFGMNEVFTTLHLPEQSFDRQVEDVLGISRISRQFNMDLTVDIGGGCIRRILSDADALRRLKDARIQFLRLDYGNTQEDIAKLAALLPVRGFVMNASTCTAEEAAAEAAFLKSLRPDMELRACHNYYVRPETGLDVSFAAHQKKIFDDLRIPVYFCVPGHQHPRGPLFTGLPTMESHRQKNLELVLLDLIVNWQAKGLLLADEYFGDEELAAVSRICAGLPVPVTVRFDAEASAEEKKIILGRHHFRYDSNGCVLRSQSSREMAEFASQVTPHHCTSRPRGAVTVDNRDYLRYSGEMQVVESGLEADPKVNVAGCVDEINMEKLSYFRGGYDYEFTEG